MAEQIARTDFFCLFYVISSLSAVLLVFTCTG